MGLIFFVGLNWLLIATLSAVAKKPRELKTALREWIAHPIKNTFLLVWLSSVLVAGWGVLTGGYLSWPVETPWGRLQSWQLGGIIAFVGLVVLFVYSAYEGHQHRKRYESQAKQD